MTSFAVAYFSGESRSTLASSSQPVLLAETQLYRLANLPKPKAQWQKMKRPSERSLELMQEFEASRHHPDPEQRGFLLASEQKAMCKWFANALDIAFDEEIRGVPLRKRTQKACLLIGGGGTGKTTIVLKLLLELFVEYFPPLDGEDRFIITTFSHAQGAAISNEKFKAKTAHTASSYRVASLRNINMALKTKKAEMEKRWKDKILLVEDEVGLFPAMVQNMLLYRTMRARQNFHELTPELYGDKGQLCGHMPIIIFAGDFLQIKAINEISVSDDLDAKRAANKTVHPEHVTAQNAILNIEDVIHLKQSKRFLDEAMPSLMQALRSSCPADPISETELDKLRARTIENCADELTTPLFSDGHIVSIYWENVARSISERAHRDAQKLNVPLYCLQAADQRATFKSKVHEQQVIHNLLTMPNIHNTGKLHGMLLLHESMVVRLSDVIAPHCGLVKDRLAEVIRVDLHPHDQRRLDNLPAGYLQFVPEFMVQGVWIRMLKYNSSPLSSQMLSTYGLAGDDATSIIYVELLNAEFKCDVNIDGTLHPVQVIRWQIPLTHGMIRTAFSAQGLTLEGGVLVDLRRAGGLEDDDWWLAIYVMLSRARKLDNLILLGFNEKVEELLRRGPPEQLIKVTHELELRGEVTMTRLMET